MSKTPETEPSKCSVLCAKHNWSQRCVAKPGRDHIRFLSNGQGDIRSLATNRMVRDLCCDLDADDVLIGDMIRQMEIYERRLKEASAEPHDVAKPPSVAGTTEPFDATRWAERILPDEALESKDGRIGFLKHHVMNMTQPTLVENKVALRRLLADALQAAHDSTVAETATWTDASHRVPLSGTVVLIKDESDICHTAYYRSMVQLWHNVSNHTPFVGVVKSWRFLPR